MKNMAKIVVLVAACVSMNMYADAQLDLFNAAKQGNLKGMQNAIAAGAKVNATDRFGSTALAYAIDSGSLGAVKALIAAGANQQSVIANISALQLAQYRSQSAIVNYLQLQAIQSPQSLGFGQNQQMNNF